jgi:putative DNA primase/helicase
MTELSFEESILREIGYAPSPAIDDGKIHRFDIGKHKDAGWYVLHNGAFPAGAFGDWVTGERHKWHLKNGATKLTDADRALIQAGKEQIKAEIAKGHGTAAKEATALWNNASPAAITHPYLILKKVAPHGIKQVDSQLIIPVFIGGEVTSVQRIYDGGTKRFLTGGRIGGGYYLIGDPGDTVVIAEGFATAATIHETTGLAAVAAFNAGNLMAVAQDIRAIYPTAKIIFAADDDFKIQRDRGENPGIDKARQLPRKLRG